MKDLFSVGEMSKLFNINIKTLRYYDDIDLFKPSFIDSTNKYRYYSTVQFEQLNTIMYLKALGMPLSAIKDHLNKRSIDHITNLFEMQREITENKIKELEVIRQKIENRITQINYARQYDNLDVIQEIEFNERTIILIKQEIRSNEDLELSIRNLENRSNKNASIFNGKVGISISFDRLMEGHFEEYDSIFLFAENEEYHRDLVKILPHGIYATVRFCGTHASSPANYNRLLEYIRDKEYTVLDASIEITLIDFGLTTDKSKFVTEIQILIKKY